MSGLKPPSLQQLGAMLKASGLKEKLLFTLGAMAVYRLGVQVPVWGVQAHALSGFLKSGLGGFLDMFSGGALGSLSVLALGIGPYITASIMMQLLTVVLPRLEEMQKDEGESGRKKIQTYTRYLAVVLALIQSTLIVRLVVNGVGGLMPGVPESLFWSTAIMSLSAGSLFTMWLAEMITERGIGNGGSLIIFMGILAGIPMYAQQTAKLVSGDPAKSFALLGLLAVFLVMIAFIIVLQEAARMVYVVSAKKQVGNKIYGGQNTHIPFKINPAGVMPIIFAFAVLAFPDTLFNLANPAVGTWLYQAKLFYGQYIGPSGWLYGIIMFLMVVFFAFFYASIVPSMQPREIAEQLKKYGTAIPGVKPGKPTSDKLEEILTRIIWIGASMLALLTLLSSYAPQVFNISTLRGLGATSLIIMVGVAMDTVNQIRVHLMAQHYEGFMKPATR